MQPGILKETGKNARRYAEQNHNIERIVRMYEDMFRKLLSNNK